MSVNESLPPRPLGSALKDIGTFFGRGSKTPRSPPSDLGECSASPAVEVVASTSVDSAVVEAVTGEENVMAAEDSVTSQPVESFSSSKEPALVVGGSKLQEALKVAGELHAYTKDRNNVHHPIKKMAVSILSALACVERELITTRL